MTLYSVPLKLWTNKGMSYVTNALGKPLYMDKVIEDAIRIGFAKVYIKLDSTVGFPNDFDLVLLNGKTIVIIEYQWRSKFCRYCKKFNYHRSTYLHNLENKEKVVKSGKQVEKS